MTRAIMRACVSVSYSSRADKRKEIMFISYGRHGWSPLPSCVCGENGRVELIHIIAWERPWLSLLLCSRSLLKGKFVHIWNKRFLLGLFERKPLPLCVIFISLPPSQEETDSKRWRGARGQWMWMSISARSRASGHQGTWIIGRCVCVMVSPWQPAAEQRKLRPGIPADRTRSVCLFFSYI